MPSEREKVKVCLVSGTVGLGDRWRAVPVTDFLDFDFCFLFLKDLVFAGLRQGSQHRRTDLRNIPQTFLDAGRRVF